MYDRVFANASLHWCATVSIQSMTASVMCGMT